ncbi:MAG: hypothetical protein AB8B87_08225 [Granulosicoccus sp.]
MNQRTTLRKLMLVSVLSFTVTACNENDQPTGQSGDISESIPGADVAPTVSNEFDDDLFQVCSLEERNSTDDGYEVATFTIDGGSDSTRTFSYTGSSCAPPAPDVVETEIESSFAYPGGSTTTPQDVATHIDTTV